MKKEEIMDVIQEIMDRNYQNFKGVNEAELFIREELSDWILEWCLPSEDSKEGHENETCQSCNNEIEGGCVCVECYLSAITPSNMKDGHAKGISTDKDAKNDLLPCPFCGGKAVARQYGTGLTIGCDSCHMSTMIYQPKIAINKWNKRFLPQENK